VEGEGRRAKGRELRVNNCAGRNVKKKKEGQIVDPTPKSLNIKECHKITNTQKLTKKKIKKLALVSRTCGIVILCFGGKKTLFGVSSIVGS